MSVDVSLNLQNRLIGGFTLTWKDISVWATKKKTSKFWTSQQYEHIRILNGVSGIVNSGSLMAIMGASGAGKTTLLATVSQRIKGPTGGEILVNGKVIKREMISRLSGFVPQEELVTKNLTVHEHISFMARLKMDRRVNQSQRLRRLNSLLSELGLLNCSTTLLCRLSGGEMKRLSLAVQLLTDPPLLFCDEPTTGLDSYNAGIVIEKLRQFAKRGKAVICTIHQPASGIFDMFHEVLLLANGRVAFHGSVPDAAVHFNNLGLECPVGYNQAEFYVSELAVIADREEECMTKIDSLCDKFHDSKYGQELRQKIFDGAQETADDTPAPINSFDGISESTTAEFQKYMNVQKVNCYIQLYWLLWRSVIDIKRSGRHYFLGFGLYMFIAFLLVTPFINIAGRVDQANIQNMEGLLYLIITETVFTFAYNVFHIFPAEIPQLLREIGNGLYKPGPFYISKIIILIPLAVIEPFVYTTVIFWFVGLHGGFWGYLEFCVTVIMSAMTATAYGCLLSAAFESVATAALVSVPIDFITMTFSGVYLNLSNLPRHLNWIRYISPFYYGTEAVSILQWTQISNITCNNGPGFPCMKTGQEVLEKYGFAASDFLMDLLGLSIIYLACHIIGFLSFWKRSKKQSVY